MLAIWLWNMRVLKGEGDCGGGGRRFSTLSGPSTQHSINGSSRGEADVLLGRAYSGVTGFGPFTGSVGAGNDFAFDCRKATHQVAVLPFLARSRTRLESEAPEPSTRRGAQRLHSIALRSYPFIAKAVPRVVAIPSRASRWNNQRSPPLETTFEPPNGSHAVTLDTCVEATLERRRLSSSSTFQHSAFVNESADRLCACFYG